LTLTISVKAIRQSIAAKRTFDFPGFTAP
jgi:hypothetical protein